MCVCVCVYDTSHYTSDVYVGFLFRLDVGVRDRIEVAKPGGTWDVWAWGLIVWEETPRDTVIGCVVTVPKSKYKEIQEKVYTPGECCTGQHVCQRVVIVLLRVLYYYALSCHVGNYRQILGRVGSYLGRFGRIQNVQTSEGE